MICVQRVFAMFWTYKIKLYLCDVNNDKEKFNKSVKNSFYFNGGERFFIQ